MGWTVMLSLCMHERNTGFLRQNLPNVNFHIEPRNMADSLIYFIYCIASANRAFIRRNPSDTNQTAVLLPNSVLLNLLVDGTAGLADSIMPSIATIHNINISTAAMYTYFMAIKIVYIKSYNNKCEAAVGSWWQVMWKSHGTALTLIKIIICDANGAILNCCGIANEMSE